MWGQRAQGTQGGQGQGAQGASPAPIPVPVLRIRQVCCGPLLGLHEDALPRRQGSLFSAGGGLGGGRRYWFTHEAAAAEQVGQGQGVGQGTSLCALLEIPLSSHRAAIRADREARERDRERVQPMHRTPSTLQREGIPEHPGDSGDAGMGGIDEEVVEGGEGDEAAVRFVDAAGLRLLADRHWPAPAHAHTHSHRHQGLGHGHGVGVGRSRLQDQPQLLSLSRQLRAILRAQDAQVQQGQAQGQVQVQQKRQQGQQGQGQAQGQQQGQQGASPILPGGPHVSELLRAVSALCLREEEVFRQAHQMYQSHQHFPLPLPLPSDGSASTSSSSASLSSQRCLQALLLWVLGSVGPQARTLLRAPSSAVLALVWAHHVQREGGQGQREGGQGGELLVAASMDADEIYFCSLLRACLGLQLVAEYLAYAQGLLDG
ncbi:hypothetical protein B484DRAFT_450131 [Ochromonadaceae sp. CCMP2298]|nr:hypothetical protein B484DRAFT_450131 [Ochromonadaceae sp. CCMP2298]